jgi:hypothetical protein
MRQCYTITHQQKISILCDYFLTVWDKIKFSWVISSWKSERKLWLKFQLNPSIFLFLSLKSVIINFGFLNKFLDIWNQNSDPDSEYGSRSWIQAQIECRSNRFRIRNTAFNSVSDQDTRWLRQIFLPRGWHQKHYSVIAITLCFVFALSHNASTLRRKVIAFYSYRSGLIEIVIASYSYPSGLIRIVIAAYS